LRLFVGKFRPLQPTNQPTNQPVTTHFISLDTTPQKKAAPLITLVYKTNYNSVTVAITMMMMMMMMMMIKQT
jgi:hypothetical protein